jgi:hypothetical protein
VTQVVGFAGFVGAVAGRLRGADSFRSLGPALSARGRHEARPVRTPGAALPKAGVDSEWQASPGFEEYSPNV